MYERDLLISPGFGFGFNEFFIILVLFYYNEMQMSVHTLLQNLSKITKNEKSEYLC